MSGGVDSSVSAYLLKEKGYEVEGVSLKLFDAKGEKTMVKCALCPTEQASDAGKAADAVRIRHTIIDVRDLFAEKVVRPFIDAYSKGMTPNPCILCNRHIKFPSLIREADNRGASFVATGHYARVISDDAKPRLLRGLDPAKDQSYVLHAISHDILSRLVLPLGEKTKSEVRSLARKLNLSAADRPESQEICFVEERSYIDFMGGISEGKGPIIDVTNGQTIGAHSGIHLYTIGQRKRLPATGKPVYVVRIDPLKNAVYIGPREMAMARSFSVNDLNWLISGLPAQMHATVKVRSTMKDEPASLHIENNGIVRVLFDEPQWAPAPGQSAVFYNGDTVLGGGVIDSLYVKP